MKTNLATDRPKQLILTVGLPYAGKTTWAQTQAGVIVNPDAVRLAVHGRRFIPAAEQLVWALVHKMVQAHFIYGYDLVILDACNETQRRRQVWLNEHWRTSYVVFDVDSRTCRNRALAARDDEIVPIIDRKAEQFQPLSEGENKFLLEVIQP